MAKSTIPNDTKDRIMIELAKGMTARKIATRFKVSVGSVSNIKTRNQDEITAIQETLSDKIKDLSPTLIKSVHNINKTYALIGEIIPRGVRLISNYLIECERYQEEGNKLEGQEFRDIAAVTKIASDIVLKQEDLQLKKDMLALKREEFLEGRELAMAKLDNELLRNKILKQELNQYGGDDSDTVIIVNDVEDFNMFEVEKND